ncbi:PREDICTED: active regulator of SIRT1-like [Polistes dominula]|uniref:Active regulator of SIRT1 n=1 Tax=Polistes dominula TaxID=743375 RepID=A0ABM1J6J7_POLDO|nr:PREDICTED: active regulator of SIRT1-like [Polistes dominula]
MPNSLVRKSLELSGYNDFNKEKKKKKNKHNGYKGTLELIPAKHRIISSKEKTNINNIFGWSKKVNIYEAKKQLKSKKDLTEENVQNLLLLSSNRLDKHMVDKVLKRAVDKRFAKKPKMKKKKKKQESTVFTEEDFKKFEEEYIDQ